MFYWFATFGFTHDSHGFWIPNFWRRGVPARINSLLDFIGMSRPRTEPQSWCCDFVGLRGNPMANCWIHRGYGLRMVKTWESPSFLKAFSGRDFSHCGFPAMHSDAEPRRNGIPQASSCASYQPHSERPEGQRRRSQATWSRLLNDFFLSQP